MAISDLSRATREGLRNVKSAGKVAIRAGINGLRFIARSYRRGVLFVYIQTGGNQAVQLSTRVLTSGDFGSIELMAHYSVSFAWFFGLLGSIVANSYRTLVNAIIYALNLALPEGSRVLQDHDTRHFLSQYVLGSPGLIVGRVLGAIGFFAVITARMVRNTLITAWRVARRMTNLALAEDNQFRLEEDKRSLLALVLGSPGIVLGIILGLLGTTVVGGWRALMNLSTSFSNTARYMTNLALADENKSPVKADNRSTIAFVLGLPGALLGVVPGVLGFSVVSAARIGWNSVITSWQISRRLMNLALASENQFVIEQDTRSTLPFVLGLPGILLGVVPGVLGFSVVSAARIGWNSVITSWQISRRLMNLALAPENQFAIEQDTRSIIPFILGLPGILAGLAYGCVGVTFIGVARTGWNSLLTTWRMTLKLTHIILSKEYKFELEEDRRAWFPWVLGLPGVPLGIGFGLVGFASVLVSRVMGNSFISAWLITRRITNLVLAEESQFTIENDNRSRLSFLLGLPGTVLGVLPGLIGLTVVGAGRVINNFGLILKTILVNMGISFVNVVKRMTNLALADENKFTVARDERSLALFSLGLLGGLLAIVPGTIGFGLGMVLRTGWNSMYASWRVSQQLMNVVLARENQFILLEDQRPWVSFGLGLPGIPFGIGFGILGMAFISAARVTWHSVITAGRVTAQIINRALSKDNQLSIEEDKRALLPWILGLPGAPLGIGLGVIGFMLAGTGRMIANSFISAWRTTREITNLALAEKNRFLIEKDNRSWSSFLLGSPGAVLGIVPGFLGLTLVIGARAVINLALIIKTIAINTALSFVSTAGYMTNLALTKEDQFALPGRNRSWREFSSGFLGAIAGSIVGVMGFLSAGLGRVAINSFKTYRDFSGSLLNLALERRVFDGLANPNKAINRWGFGFPGLLLSLSTVAVGIGILSLRKMVPIIFSIVASPMVAFWRAVAESNKYVNHQFRFSKGDHQDKVVASFKNLFASLTAGGQLPEGQKISKAIDSPIYTTGFLKNVLKFFRKALTFNQQSLTERVLSYALEEYRVKKAQPASATEQDAALADKAVEDSVKRIITACENDSHWVTPDSEKDEIKAEVRRVADFLKVYIKARCPEGAQIASAMPVEGPIIEENPVPPLYTAEQEHLYTLFWGGRYKGATDDPTPNPGVSVGNRA